jgi:hypothetical protein
MRPVLALPLLTAHGPDEVYIDTDTARDMIPILQEFLEKAAWADGRGRGDIIDMVQCEQCHVFMVAVIGHCCG